jgi:predicted metalloprotease
MKWKRTGRESDVIDRRGGGGGSALGGRGVQIGGGGGLVGIIVVLAITLLGGDPSSFSIPNALGPGAQVEEGKPIPRDKDPDRDLRDFSVFVFTDVQDTWTTTFRAESEDYERAKLVLYSGATNTGGCGLGQAAAGPFYCPADKRVYLDLSFYREMERKLNAGGEFAWAYVIAHEVGHHVQNELGTSDEVDRLSRENPDDRNELSVRLELQADCYAGVWARAVFDQLEDGDIEEAMAASQAVGDDRLQKQAGQRVNPDSFTHGSSAQRLRWFTRGSDKGQPEDCDTFSADEL